MRTKTPHQINQQALRLMKALSEGSWNGKEYANEHYDKMFDRVFDASEKYIENIYNHNGVDERNCNRYIGDKIYYTAATPANIYMKQTH